MGFEIAQLEGLRPCFINIQSFTRIVLYAPTDYKCRAFWCAAIPFYSKIWSYLPFVGFAIPTWFPRHHRCVHLPWDGHCHSKAVRFGHFPQMARVATSLMSFNGNGNVPVGISVLRNRRRCHLSLASIVIDPTSCLQWSFKNTQELFKSLLLMNI